MAMQDRCRRLIEILCKKQEEAECLGDVDQTALLKDHESATKSNLLNLIGSGQKLLGSKKDTS